MADKRPVRVDSVVRALLREAQIIERDSWEGQTPHGNVERDRYIQGLRDAVVIIRRVADRTTTR